MPEEIIGLTLSVLTFSGALVPIQQWRTKGSLYTPPSATIKCLFQQLFDKNLLRAPPGNCATCLSAIIFLTET